MKVKNIYVVLIYTSLIVTLNGIISSGITATQKQTFLPVLLNSEFCWINSFYWYSASPQKSKLSGSSSYPQKAALGGPFQVLPPSYLPTRDHHPLLFCRYPALPPSLPRALSQTSDFTIPAWEKFWETKKQIAAHRNTNLHFMFNTKSYFIIFLGYFTTNIYYYLRQNTSFSGYEVSYFSRQWLSTRGLQKCRLKGLIPRVSNSIGYCGPLEIYIYLKAPSTTPHWDVLSVKDTPRRVVTYATVTT